MPILWSESSDVFPRSVRDSLTSSTASLARHFAELPSTDHTLRRPQPPSGSRRSSTAPRGPTQKLPGQALTLQMLGTSSPRGPKGGQVAGQYLPQRPRREEGTLCAMTCKLNAVCSVVEAAAGLASKSSVFLTCEDSSFGADPLDPDPIHAAGSSSNFDQLLQECTSSLTKFAVLHGLEGLLQDNNCGQLPLDQPSASARGLEGTLTLTSTLGSTRVTHKDNLTRCRAQAQLAGGATSLEEALDAAGTNPYRRVATRLQHYSTPEAYHELGRKVHKIQQARVASAGPRRPAPPPRLIHSADPKLHQRRKEQVRATHLQQLKRWQGEMTRRQNKALLLEWEELQKQWLAIVLMANAARSYCNVQTLAKMKGMYLQMRESATRKAQESLMKVVVVRRKKKAKQHWAVLRLKVGLLLYWFAFKRRMESLAKVKAFVHELKQAKGGRNLLVMRILHFRKQVVFIQRAFRLHVLKRRFSVASWLRALNASKMRLEQESRKWRGPAGWAECIKQKTLGEYGHVSELYMEDVALPTHPVPFQIKRQAVLQYWGARKREWAKEFKEYQRRKKDYNKWVSSFFGLKAGTHFARNQPPRPVYPRIRSFLSQPMADQLVTHALQVQQEQEDMMKLEAAMMYPSNRTLYEMARDEFISNYYHKCKVDYLRETSHHTTILKQMEDPHCAATQLQLKKYTSQLSRMEASVHSMTNCHQRRPTKIPSWKR